MAGPDISAQRLSFKSVPTLAPSAFEIWATREGYETAPAVSPADNRQYADRQTQAVYEGYQARAAEVARLVTESTFETEALRQKLLAIAVSA